MKRMILILIALSVLLFSVGCDPFGSTGTIAYIIGTIYTDVEMTIPAEGVTVELLVNKDSSAVRTQTVLTNADGVFFMEAQFYPSLPGEDAGAGYSIPSSSTVGLEAHQGGKVYTYRSADAGLTITAGDTLALWPIDLSVFAGGE